MLDTYNKYGLILKYNGLYRLPKKLITLLLIEYDKYIINYYENHDTFCIPVCLLEFYNNEFELILENMKRRGQIRCYK